MFVISITRFLATGGVRSIGGFRGRRSSVKGLEKEKPNLKGIPPDLII